MGHAAIDSKNTVMALSMFGYTVATIAMTTLFKDPTQRTQVIERTIYQSPVEIRYGKTNIVTFDWDELISKPIGHGHYGH